MALPGISLLWTSICPSLHLLQSSVVWNEYLVPQSEPVLEHVDLHVLEHMKKIVLLLCPVKMAVLCILASTFSKVFSKSWNFTCFHIAPEVVSEEPLCLASDMWSMGVLTYVLWVTSQPLSVTRTEGLLLQPVLLWLIDSLPPSLPRLSGISPFFTDSPGQSVIERIKEARYDFYDSQFEQISPEAKDFISVLLQKSSDYRMTATQALQHSWIRVSGALDYIIITSHLHIRCSWALQ